MQLIAPDILAQVLGLSAPACAVGLAIGALLWLFGWWGHRFWVVMFATVVAGIVGLSSGRVAGVTPIVAGLLLAISAGMMALALARVLAFVAGGAAVCLALAALAPAWEDRLLGFLGGGLLALFLFRWWMMTLTSLAGTLMMSYAGLALLDRMGKLDALALADKRGLVLNGLCVGAALLGVLAQYLVERWRKQLKKRRDEHVHLRQAEMELEKRLRRRSWWPWAVQKAA